MLAPNEDSTVVSSTKNSSTVDLTDNSATRMTASESNLKGSNLYFSSKGLHLCNLNIQHILPKLDELRTIMSTDKCPDVLGVCETFLASHVSDGQISIEGYDLIRKDRSDTQDKCARGGGLIFYYRNTLNCKRRPELEISKLETIWVEFPLPNSKPILICTVYRPPSVQSEWTDLFEREISIAQTTGLELILMGDFNIDYKTRVNKKWLNLIELFDLSQLVSQPTRITHTTDTIIDHFYTPNPEHITECYVASLSISDHFPICLTRKINCKITKTAHLITTYRCFKQFDETKILLDLENDLSTFL